MKIINRSLMLHQGSLQVFFISIFLLICINSAALVKSVKYNRGAKIIKT